MKTNGGFQVTKQARDLKQDYEAVSAQMSEIYYQGFFKEEIRKDEYMYQGAN